MPPKTVKVSSYVKMVNGKAVVVKGYKKSSSGSASGYKKKSEKVPYNVKGGASKGLDYGTWNNPT